MSVSCNAERLGRKDSKKAEQEDLDKDFVLLFI